MINAKRILFTLFISTIALLFAFNNLSSQQTAGELFEKALYMEEAKGDLQKAIELYQKILKQFPENREVAAKAQLHIGLCYEKLGLKEAPKAYQKVIDNFPDQTEAVKVAKEKLSILLRAQAMLEKGDKEFKMTKIPIDPEKTAYAFISPDGKKLAFVGGEGDIWVREIDSSKDTRLTQTPVFDFWCFWSPDSEMIAYLDILNGLHLVSAKGGESRTLIAADSEFRKAGYYAWPVGWTPDGKMIICCILPSKGLSAIPVSGGEWKEIFKFSDPKIAEEFSLAVISPDGKLIAYQSKKAGNDDIYIIPVKGGESVQITDHPATDSMPAWSVDGKWLAFETLRSGTKEIWAVKISPDGDPEGESFRVAQGSTNPSMRATIYNWTKDGKIGINTSLGFSNIFMADYESKKETQLTNVLSGNYGPRWSPDGKKIAFISDRGGKRDIWIMLSSGGDARRITGNITSQEFLFISSPTWSPDGKNIAFVIGFGEKQGIWIIPAEGGPVKKLEDDYDGIIGIMGKIDWSPDGKNIAFSYHRQADAKNPIPDSRIYYEDIYTIPVDGGEPLRITKLDQKELSFRSPCWSPDGKKIAFFAVDLAKYQEGKNSDGIGILDAQQWDEPEMIAENQTGPLGGLSWSPDGKKIIYSGWDKNKMKIYQVSSEGGEIQNLNIEGFSPDFSPDGKNIIFRRVVGSRTEFWLIENFLPGEKTQKKSNTRN